MTLLLLPRYYDLSIARFLSEDPIRFAAGHNFYPYVLNSPGNFRDPNGHIGEGWGTVIGIFIGTHYTPLPNGGFIYYGNWGGPGWTGGQTVPYEDLTQEQQKNLAAPIDDQDACYQDHDLCYSRSRVKNHCTSRDHPGSKQRTEETYDEADCDKALYECLSVRVGNNWLWIAERVFQFTSWYNGRPNQSSKPPQPFRP